jgi:hypothetical protein
MIMAFDGRGAHRPKGGFCSAAWCDGTNLRCGAGRIRLHALSVRPLGPTAVPLHRTYLTRWIDCVGT